MESRRGVEWNGLLCSERESSPVLSCLIVMCAVMESSCAVL